MTRVLFGALLLLGLGACTTQPQSARQGVFAVVTAYDGALKTALVYKSLPRCGQPTSPPVCSDAGVVATLVNATTVTAPVVNGLITTAESTTATDTAVTVALVAAQQSVGAFTAIVSQLTKGAAK